MLPNFPNIKRRTLTAQLSLYETQYLRLTPSLRTLRVTTAPSTACRGAATAQTDKDAVVHTPDATHSPLIFLRVVPPSQGSQRKMPGSTKPPSAHTSPLRRPRKQGERLPPGPCGSQPFPVGAETVLKVPLFQRICGPGK